MNLRDIIPEQHLSNILDKSTKQSAALGESADDVIMEAKLTKDQIRTLFVSVEQLVKNTVTEGVWDSIKSAAGKTAGAVSNKIKNITTKVTADNLMKVWVKSGSPTDSNDIAKLLYNNKIPMDVIKQSFKSSKIPLPWETKSSKTKSSKTKSSKTTTGSNIFSQMSGQLTSPTVSSTGGQTTQTATGVKHTSSANLPIKKLEKNWIEYLKNNQIVQMKSDPESGKLVYKRPATTEDVKHFLDGQGYDEDQVNTAFSFVKISGKPVPTAVAPSPPAAAPAEKRKGGRQAGAALSQTPDAIRKREARQKKKSGISEELTDAPLEVSEQDIEKIFSELLKSKPVSENVKDFDRLLVLAGVSKPTNIFF